MTFTIMTLLAIATAFAQETEKLTAEPNHSTIGFAVPIGGGLTRVTGKFTDFDLNFDYVEKKLTRSKVVFAIKTASITTDIKDRDDHLRTADFFDAEKFPEITFRSTNITQSGDKFTMEGTLQMHGVEKNVAIPVQITGEIKNTVGIQIRWHLNRKDYGIGNNFKHTTMENFLSDDIDIEINLWTKVDKRG